MIRPEFPPSSKEGAWLAVCVGVLGSALIGEGRMVGLLIPSGEACHLNTHPVDRFVRLVPELN